MTPECTLGRFPVPQSTSHADQPGLGLPLGSETGREVGEMGQGKAA